MILKLTITVFFISVVYYLERAVPHVEGLGNRLKHALNNLSMGAINALIPGFVFASVLLTFTSQANTYSFGLLNIVSLPVYLKYFFAFILFDLWMYLWHRMNHRVRFLWLFHRTHHSDIAMDSTTAFRFHIGEITASSVLRLAVIPILGMGIKMLLLYEVALQAFVIFHHSNIGLKEKYDRVLRAVIVTPNMHRVHHSIERAETDSNYSSIFSIWDRIFNSFRKRHDTREITYGLDKYREHKWQGILGMLATPFIKIDKKAKTES